MAATRLLPSFLSRISTAKVPLLRISASFCQNIRLSTEIGYEQFEKLRKEKSTTIIDVREVEELIATSVIPGSINIPLGELEKAFSMSEDSFQKQFDAQLPEKDDPVVMLCLKGIRAEKARLLLENQFGYKNTGTYVGSYAEWINKHN